MCIHWCGQGLSAKTCASEDKPRERTGVDYVEKTWKGWSVIQAATGGVHERNPGPSQRASIIISKFMKKRTRPTIASSFSAQFQLAWQHFYGLWNPASTRVLPIYGNEAEIKAGFLGPCDLGSWTEIWALSFQMWLTQVYSSAPGAL